MLITDKSPFCWSKTGWSHYVAQGKVNGQPVTFLLDTGATLVAVPENTAKELGLRKGRRYVSNRERTCYNL